MADQNRTLEIDVRLDNKGLKKDIRQADREMKGLGSSIKTLGPIVAGAFGTAAIAGFAANVAEVTAEYQKLEAMLKTATGSADKANKKFADLQKFAKETPFTVNQVTEAFIKLKNLGLDPSEDALRSYGNTASAMGKDVTQFIEAVADASVNEFERLKEFGIKARQEGDNVSFTFRGVTTTVKKSSEEIQGYLQAIGDTEFAGAMSDQMATLGGATSNAGVAFDLLAASIGEKLSPSLIGATNAAATLADQLRALIAPTVDDEVGKLAREIEGLNQQLADAEERGLWGNNSDEIDRYKQNIEEATQRLREFRLEQFSGSESIGAAAGVTGAGATANVGGAAGGGSIGTGETGGMAGMLTMTDAGLESEALQARQDAYANNFMAIIGLNQWANDTMLASDAQREMSAEQLLQQRQQAAAGILKNMASLADGESRKGFEISKAAAIAETSINTVKAAQGAYSALAPIVPVGPVLGAIAAAAAVAAGVKNVQKIKSTKFGGGGGGKGAVPTAPAIGGAGANFGTTPIAQPQQAVPTQPQAPQIKVVSNNTLIGKIVEEEVIPAINDSLRRGVSLDLEFT